MIKEITENVKKLAYSAGYGISMDPKRYGDSLLKDLEDGLTDFQSRIPDEFKEEYSKRYVEKFCEWMRALSRCVSTFVTGPANFNTKRANKMNDYERAAHERFENWREKVIKRLNREKRLTGWAEVERLQEKLERLTELHEQMKAVNKVARDKKLSESDKIDELVALGLKEELAKGCLHPEYDWQRPGFEDYLLKNNLARIKETQKLIERHTLFAESEDKTYSFDGGEVELSYSDERVRIYFDEKPDEELRARLKKEAFKWSPRNEAWQRQLTEMAMSATKRLLGVDIFKEAPETNEEA